jgi:hypothetical protein
VHPVTNDLAGNGTGPPRDFDHLFIPSGWPDPRCLENAPRGVAQQENCRIISEGPKPTIAADLSSSMHWPYELAAAVDVPDLLAGKPGHLFGGLTGYLREVKD